MLNVGGRNVVDIILCPPKLNTYRFSCWDNLIIQVQKASCISSAVENNCARLVQIWSNM